MKRPWVDAVGGQAVLEPIAKECGVELTESQYRFLNRFGTIVEASVRGRDIGSNQIAKAERDLKYVCDYVSDEVNKVVDNLESNVKIALQVADVCTTTATGLPVVRLRLPPAPELIIMVTRSYIQEGIGVSYGFIDEHSRTARLKGVAAKFASQLDEACRPVGWQLSVTQVLQVWISAFKRYA